MTEAARRDQLIAEPSGQVPDAAEVLAADGFGGLHLDGIELSRRRMSAGRDVYSLPEMML